MRDLEKLKIKQMRAHIFETEKRVHAVLCGSFIRIPKKGKRKEKKEMEKLRRISKVALLT
jgi:hypothetical protein